MIFLILLVILSVFSYADNLWYQLNPQRCDSLDVKIHKQVMNNFFSDPKIEWDKDGIYLFIKKWNTLQLFYFDGSHSACLYQLPRQTKSKWLNTSEYLEERLTFKKNINNNNCKKNFIIEDSKKINSIPFEHLPDITLLSVDSNCNLYTKEPECLECLCKYSEISSKYTREYFGYKRNNSKADFFYFRDFRNGINLLNSPLNKFQDVFDVLDSPPFSLMLENCQ